MNASLIVYECGRRGVALFVDRASIRMRGQAGALTEGLRDAIRANRDAILAILSDPDQVQSPPPSTTPSTFPGETVLGNRDGLNPPRDGGRGERESQSNTPK